MENWCKIFICFASKIKAKMLLCIEGKETLLPFDAKQNSLLHLFFHKKKLIVKL